MNARSGLRFPLIAGALLVAAAPVDAITNGEPDGNAHPMVGGLFADFDGNGTISGDELVCSGSFAGRSKDGGADVFLTAAHCIEFGPDIGITQWYVSFDDAVLDADGPTGLIASIDAAWDPAFFFRRSDGRDFGVVLLPAGSVAGIQPVILPAAGALDALKHGAALMRIDAESVGYGLTAQFKQREGVQFEFDGLRRRVDTQLKGLTQAYALYNENSDATGGGGTCFGDSGSPQFMKGTRNILSVTFLGDPLCRATESNTRLDTPEARAFLGQYLNLP